MRPTVLCAAILAATFGGQANAARINYQIEVVALHSDNLNLSEDNQVSETVLVPRLKFDVKEEGASIKLEARGEIERRHYRGNEFPDENRSRFAGQLNWSLLPERLSLVFEDYLSEESINLRDGRYPGNLQRVNVFLAGPSYFARFDDATRLQLDLRAADNTAEVSTGFDGRRYSAAAALQRDLTPSSKASLNVAYTRAEFDDPGATVDYTREDGFVRYEGNLRNVEYQLDAGHSRLNRESGGDASTAIARATVQWQISPQNRLRFRGRHQFADEVQDLIIRLSDPDESLAPDLVDISDSLVTAGVYRQHALELDYRYAGDRFGLRLRPMYRRLRYIDQPDGDRTERGAFFQVDYRPRPRMNVFLSGSARKREFLARDEQHRDRVYSLGIDYQLTRHWGYRAEAIWNERDSNLSDPRYEEKAVQFTVWWKR
ncbi:hypothetical protein [Montanilutibacter psychrotolerans]|uniref:Outer membrane beta-barrel protein n=1 Tax=Montanilutibacter psychrotolerans TaxID=1327343 RepID=A0A3M8SVN2_9GAMM|nr:hypothetical protein [Lysobacter psychrotolerans]RNF83294.1 hypothetical protein EER27_12440 [Lysobacter psychrotolerans]